MFISLVLVAKLIKTNGSTAYKTYNTANTKLWIKQNHLHDILPLKYGKTPNVTWTELKKKMR